MKIKKTIKNIRRYLKERWCLVTFRDAEPGTVGWLVRTEIKYGGFHSGMKRNKVSPLDPRSEDEIQKGGMTGGDRMLHNAYAEKYEAYLKPFLNDNGSIVLAEVGILKGVGLAVWSELFPEARIIGLDIDLGHISSNLQNLKDKGAFARRAPELYEFDQFRDNVEFFRSVLGDSHIDIMIDDGYHSDESILNTLKDALPYLADRFVYFIEDNRHVHLKIKELYPQLYVDNTRDFTVVSRSNV